MLLDPVLPAREVAVAYLNECGFHMFEPHEKGVRVHGEVGVVDEELAELRLNEIRSFAEVECLRMVVEQENWNATWESEYPIVEVLDEEGRLACTIRAPFHPKPEFGMDVLVAPQMSFGTGHHATTYLVTQQLLMLSLDGKSVLDMGCGTGVLALVSAKAGASKVVGVDIENDAVLNSEGNAALNEDLDLSSVDLKFLQGTSEVFDSSQHEEFEVICANIHKNVLTNDMPTYERLLVPGGVLLLSGFFEGDVSALGEVAHDVGLSCQQTTTKEGWACMRCWKPLAAS